MPKHRSRPRSLGSALLSLALVTSLSVPAFAFKPNDPQGHKDIVRDALRGVLFRTRDGVQIRFEESVIEAIAQADADVDRGLFGMVSGTCDPLTQEFCNPVAHCDDERLPECGDRVKSIRAGLLALRLPTDVARARREFGRAMHTIQDFYSHSNWVDADPGPGRTAIHPRLGSGTLDPAPAGITCDSSFAALSGAGLSEITSGYFSLRLLYRPPAGKCLHGRPLPTPQAGIAKDDPDHPFFPQARELAVLNTREYVQDIFSQWDSSMVEFLLALTSPRAALGIAVDATGSMGAELAALASAAPELAAAAAQLGAEPPALLAGAPTSASAAAPPRGRELPGALRTLAAAAASDTDPSPEPRLLQALAAAPEGSPLFFFTDRCAEPPAAEFAEAQRAASARANAVHVIFTQHCPAAEGPYGRLALHSGGQLLRIREPEIAASAAWLRAALVPERQTLLQLNGAIAGERVLEFPVDSTIRELHVSVSADSLVQLQAFDPRGAPALAGGAGAEQTRASDSALLRIREPAPGIWKLRIAGGVSVEAPGRG